MMILLMYMFLFLYFSGLWVFCSKRKHLLIVLLSLEYMVLSIFMILSLNLINMSYEMYFLMIFLVFVVCEGVLGLGVLISMIRSHGNDFFQSYMVLRC